MTRVDKSPEQLNAEAQPIEERDLDAAIAVHRLLYQAETLAVLAGLAGAAVNVAAYAVIR